MAICELVGGPRDGEKFTIPGAYPPEQIRVLDTRNGPLIMWHVAARSVYSDAKVVVCTLDDEPTTVNKFNEAWRYLWPRQER